jgi:hypothetical protein
MTKQECLSIGSVFSPFFGEEIIFDINGWNHLINDGTGKRRSNQEIQSREVLIHKAIELLSKNFPPQEFQQREYTKVDVDYYSFIYATIDLESNEKRIKVIIRQKTNGKKHFYSINSLPHQRHSKKPPEGG